MNHTSHGLKMPPAPPPPPARRAAPVRLLATGTVCTRTRAPRAPVGRCVMLVARGYNLYNTFSHTSETKDPSPQDKTPTGRQLSAFSPRYSSVARLRPERSTEMQTSSLRQRQADCPAHSLLVLRVAVAEERHVLPFRHLLNVPVKVGGARLHAWGRQL